MQLSSKMGKLLGIVRSTVLNEVVEAALKMSFQYSITPREISFSEVGNQTEIRLRKIYTTRKALTCSVYEVTI
jgi:hypothetical protein